jgi:hypothetical protein
MPVNTSPDGVVPVGGQDLPSDGVGGLVAGIGLVGDAAGVSRPDEDLADLRAVTLGGDLGGEEAGGP